MNRVNSVKSVLTNLGQCSVDPSAHLVRSEPRESCQQNTFTTELAEI